MILQRTEGVCCGAARVVVGCCTGWFPTTLQDVGDGVLCCPQWHTCITPLPRSYLRCNVSAFARRLLVAANAWRVLAVEGVWWFCTWKRGCTHMLLRYLPAFVPPRYHDLDFISKAFCRSGVSVGYLLPLRGLLLLPFPNFPERSFFAHPARNAFATTWAILATELARARPVHYLPQVPVALCWAAAGSLWVRLCDTRWRCAPFTRQLTPGSCLCRLLLRFRLFFPFYGYLGYLVHRLHVPVTTWITFCMPPASWNDIADGITLYLPSGVWVRGGVWTRCCICSVAYTYLYGDFAAPYAGVPERFILTTAFSRSFCGTAVPCCVSSFCWLLACILFFSFYTLPPFLFWAFSVFSFATIFLFRFCRTVTAGIRLRAATHWSAVEGGRLLRILFIQVKQLSSSGAFADCGRYLLVPDYAAGCACARTTYLDGLERGIACLPAGLAVVLRDRGFWNAAWRQRMNFTRVLILFPWSFCCLLYFTGNTCLRCRLLLRWAFFHVNLWTA